MEIENEDQIINFGAFEYDCKKMSSVLGAPEKEVEKEMNDKASTFHRLYHKGNDLADYAIDAKLFEMATNGDIKALAKFDERKERRLR